MNSSIISDTNNINNNKNLNRFKSCSNIPSRVRLNTLTNSYLLSPTLKSRQLFDYRSTNNLISIQENEETLVFPFNFASPLEEEVYEDENIFKKNEKKNEIKDFNFIGNNKDRKKKRKKTFEKNKKFIIIDYKERNNSLVISENNFFI